MYLQIYLYKFNLDAIENITVMYILLIIIQKITLTMDNHFSEISMHK